MEAPFREAAASLSVNIVQVTRTVMIVVVQKILSKRPAYVSPKKRASKLSSERASDEAI